MIRRIFESAPPDAINLGLGQPDLPTPAVVALAGIAGIAQGRTGYTPTAGDPELRDAVARRHAACGFGREGVLITVGSQEAMFASCLALVDPEDEVLVPDPGYPSYPTMVRLVGGRPVAYPLRAEHGFQLRAEDIEQRLTERTRLVILTAPSNPTGSLIPRPELARLVELLGKRGVPWLSDELYAAFHYDGQLTSPAELNPAGGLVVGGVSKELSMTGWRVGWLVGPPPIVARLVSVHQHLVTCAPSISQRAALAGFTPEGEAARASQMARFRRRRELMAEALARIPQLRFALPDGGFYFFVDVSAYGDALEIGRRLLERRRVITIPGTAFGPGGAGHLRLSFAAAEEDIRRGIEAIRCELAG